MKAWDKPLLTITQVFGLPAALWLPTVQNLQNNNLWNRNLNEILLFSGSSWKYIPDCIVIYSETIILSSMSCKNQIQESIFWGHISFHSKRFCCKGCLYKYMEFPPNLKGLELYYVILLFLLFFLIYFSLKMFVLVLKKVTLCLDIFIPLIHVFYYPFSLVIIHYM